MINIPVQNDFDEKLIQMVRNIFDQPANGSAWLILHRHMESQYTLKPMSEIHLFVRACERIFDNLPVEYNNVLNKLSIKRQNVLTTLIMGVALQRRWNICY